MMIGGIQLKIKAMDIETIKLILKIGLIIFIIKTLWDMSNMDPFDYS